MLAISQNSGSRAALGLPALNTKVLLIIGSSTAAGGGYESPDKPLYGGSGVGGTNSAGAGWVADTLTAAGWSVINVGVGSTDSTYWLAALPGHLATYRPDVVIVACSSAATGDNVVGSEANFNAYLSRHMEMFRLIRQAGAVPVCAPQLPNDTYSVTMLDRMRRFQRWLAANDILSWDILSPLASEAMNGQFLVMSATCSINATVNFTTTSLQPKVGMYVSGTGIAANTRVATFTPGTGGTFTIAATLTNAAAALTFGTTIDGTHLSSKAGAHAAAYKALPIDLITQNGGRRPELPPYTKGPGIQYGTGSDTGVPITVPMTGLDSFSVTFDFRKADAFNSTIPLCFAGPDSSNIRLRTAPGSIMLKFETSGKFMQSDVLLLNSTDGRWRRWCITYNALTSKWRLFLDGLQVTAGNLLEADGSATYVPDTAVTAINFGNGVGANNGFYVRGEHAFRNIVIHSIPLSAGAVLAMNAGVMRLDSLYAWFPCDDATRNSSNQLPLGGQLQNLAGTLATATLSAAQAFIPAGTAIPEAFPQYTVATVPTAANYPTSMIYVSNEAGGATLAFSDGTNWRRVHDRAIIS